MICTICTSDWHGNTCKALANEDTLLLTYCCPWCFSGCANRETFVAGTKCFWTKSETFLYPGHKICVRNKCCARGQTGKHLCRQQRVRNNVSSFARGLYAIVDWLYFHTCFRRIWRILQISEGVIHLGLQPLWITPSLICRILHILRN